MYVKLVAYRSINCNLQIINQPTHHVVKWYNVSILLCCNKEWLYARHRSGYWVFINIILKNDIQNLYLTSYFYPIYSWGRTCNPRVFGNRYKNNREITKTISNSLLDSWILPFFFIELKKKHTWARFHVKQITYSPEILIESIIQLMGGTQATFRDCNV